MTAPTFGRFFLPGPTEVHPEVMAAMQRPMIGHRSGAMEQLLAGLQPGLAQLFRTTRTVLVGTTSATGFMEMAVRNGVRQRALSLVDGAFSERFANLVRACGKECIRLDRSEEHTSELQSLAYLVCRLLLEKKKDDEEGRQR